MNRRQKNTGKKQVFLLMLMALIMGILLFFPVIAKASTPAGTQIQNVAPVDFVFNIENRTSSSNQTTVTVNSVMNITINPPHTEYLQAGKSINLSHTITNNSNSADTIDLEAASTLGLTIELFASDGVTPLTDTDSDGKVDTGILAIGGSIDIVEKLSAPENLSDGQIDETTLTAASSVDPAVKSSVTDKLTILAAKFWDPLEKTVDPPGQLTQGSIITYTNTFGNAGSIPATNVAITDPLDPNLIYIDGSASGPGGISGNVITYNPVARTITWAIPSVPAGYAGAISFKARINPDMPSDTNIGNTITITSDQIPAGESSNTATLTVVESPLRITKTANHEVAEIGDYIVYTVGVKNVSEKMTAHDVTVIDNLPQGFRYLKKSAALDGNEFHDPEKGTVLRWNIGSITPGNSKTLTYRTIISIDAPLGNGINSAVVSGKSPGGNNLNAGTANAKVKIKEGVLNSKAIILGRVFVDLNRDKMPDEDEPGIKGVRLYLEDGAYVITDGDGKFSIYGVRAGEHALKIDKTTIPAGYETVALDSSFAGDGNSRFISVPFGGPARGDFALAPIDKEAAATIEKETPAQKKKQYTFGSELNPASIPLEQQIQTMPAAPEILEPENGKTLTKAWSDIVIRIPEGSDYSLMVNGVSIPQKNIGKTIHETERKILIYQYVGINLEAGRNEITLGTETPDGHKETNKIEVLVPGSPEKIVINPDKAEIPADGKTVLPFTVKLLDRWNMPSLEEHIITVITEKGVILDDDLDPSEPGHQIKAQNGIAKFRLKSTEKTGLDKIKVLPGSMLEGGADIYFTPEMRDWIIVGVGSYTAGDRDIKGHVENITETDDFEEGIYHEGRLAFFAKGKILGKYLLTAAYDSKKEKNEDELFQKVEPDRYYPVYGDSSEIGYEAESQGQLYVKIESGRSSIMYGDYHTDLTNNEFTKYTRTFNGVKADIETKHVTVKAFGASTSQTITRDEIRGNGTSGFYFLSKSPVIENSETVRLEVRDRYHPERIISTIDKARNTDYTINYIGGTILFNKPVSSVDDNLNPVFIIVTYESDDPGDKHYIYGGRAGFRTESGSELGVTGIVAENDLKDTTLYGVDAAVKITDKTLLKAEAAQSDTFEKKKDEAWKAEVTTEMSDKLNVKVYYRNVGEEFHNPSMSGSEAGTGKYGAEAGYKAAEKTIISAESFVQDNEIEQAKLQKSSIGIKHSLTRFSVESGYAHLREERSEAGGEDIKTSQIAFAGVSGSITDRLSASLRRDQVISSDEIEDYQTKTALKFDYKFTTNTAAHLTQEFQEGEETRRDTTTFGIDSRVTENTTLTSKYLIENTVSGYRAQASIGMNNKWEIMKGLTLNTTAERIQEVKGEGGDNTALALSAEYLPRKDFKTTGRYELRFADDETTNLYTLGIASRINRSVSLLSKMSLWNKKRDAGTDVIFDGLGGIAYRPPGKNSIYLLSTLRYKHDSMGTSVTRDKTKKIVSSTELSYKVNPQWTLLGKYAGKYSWEDVGDKKFKSYTDLILAGLLYDITDKWYTGVSVKLMSQYQTKMRSTGAIIKTGYRPAKNFNVEAGYNSSEMDDRDLSGASYRARGPFFNMNFKFDEDTFKPLDRLEHVFE